MSTSSLVCMRILFDTIHVAIPERLTHPIFQIQGHSQIVNRGDKQKRVLLISLTSSLAHLPLCRLSQIYAFHHFINQLLCPTPIQTNLNSLSSWCSKRNLSLHVIKCSNMRLSLSTTDPLTYIFYSPLNQDVKHCDLGIIVTHILPWSEYYSYICSNAYCSLVLLSLSYPIQTVIVLSAMESSSHQRYPACMKYPMPCH